MNKNEPLPIDNTGTGKLGSVRIEMTHCNCNCDCCRFLIGFSEHTIINKHGTQLFICEDCLPKEQIKEVNGKWMKQR
jgi:hypothetical protein